MKLSEEIKIRFNEKFKQGDLPWLRGGDREFVKLFAQRVLAHASEPQLLDLGCGDGWASVYFASLGIDVTGLDSSEVAIRMAKAHAKEAGATRVRFEVGDGLHLSYKEHSFDAVFDRGMFHHQPRGEWGTYHRAVTTVLKPGGLFYLSGYSDLSTKKGFFPRPDGRLWYRYKDAKTGYWSYDHYFNRGLFEKIFRDDFVLLEEHIEEQAAASGSRLLCCTFQKTVR